MAAPGWAMVARLRPRQGGAGIAPADSILPAMQEQPWPTDCAALVPVYNHAASVGQVVGELVAVGATVLCVDDGSTDGSGDAAAAAGAHVLRRQPNQGKGLALQAGFARLATQGWRRVCTVDADGQHPSAEALRLAIASNEDPTALWVGSRDMRAAPGASRFGRRFSDFWVRLIGGQWPGDAQSGLRVYPLPDITQLRFGAKRYSFEVEVLIRASWGGIPLRRLPVSVIYPADRISHFHKFHDNFRTSAVFLRLLLRRLLPWPQRRIRPRKRFSFRGLFHEGDDPAGLGIAAGMGAAIGVSPLPGLQTIVLTWLACTLRLNLPMAFLASNISLGPLLAVWAGLAIAIGSFISSGATPLETFHQARATLAAAEDFSDHWQLVLTFLRDWALGSVVVMPGVALLVGVPVWSIARRCQRRARMAS